MSEDEDDPYAEEERKERLAFKMLLTTAVPRRAPAPVEHDDAVEFVASSKRGEVGEFTEFNVNRRLLKAWFSAQLTVNDVENEPPLLPSREIWRSLPMMTLLPSSLLVGLFTDVPLLDSPNDSMLHRPPEGRRL